MMVKPDMAVNTRTRKRIEGVQGCELKVRYPNRRAACVARDRIRKRDGIIMESYHCHEHHCWHVGNMPK